MEIALSTKAINSLGRLWEFCHDFFQNPIEVVGNLGYNCQTSILPKNNIPSEFLASVDN